MPARDVLLWRAGLVCAAMKYVSPSAVLLSLMAAIFAEGVLAELAVRLLGGIGPRAPGPSERSGGAAFYDKVIPDLGLSFRPTAAYRNQSEDKTKCNSFPKRYS